MDQDHKMKLESFLKAGRVMSDRLNTIACSEPSVRHWCEKIEWKAIEITTAIKYVTRAPGYRGKFSKEDVRLINALKGAAYEVGLIHEGCLNRKLPREADLSVIATRLDVALDTYNLPKAESRRELLESGFALGW